MKVILFSDNFLKHKDKEVFKTPTCASTQTGTLTIVNMTLTTWSVS